MVQIDYYPKTEQVRRVLAKQQRTDSQFVAGHQFYWVPRQANFDLQHSWCEKVTLDSTTDGLFVRVGGETRTAYANELLAVNHPILRRPPEPRTFDVLPETFMGGQPQIFEPAPLMV